MNHRERRLALIVGGAIGIVFAWKAVEWTIITPSKRVNEDILAATQRRITLDNELAGGARVLRNWQERTARALGPSVAQTRHLFREQMNELLEKHALNEGVRLGDGLPQALNNEGFIALPVTLRSSGNLQALVEFLRDFYNRPYYTRITNLTVTAEDVSAPRGRGADRNQPLPDPKLNITLNAAALVLPVLKDADGKLVKGQMHGQAAEAPEAERLARSDEEYALLTARNIFKKWVKEREVVVAPPPPPGPKGDQRDPQSPPPPPPPRDPRRDADKLKLSGTESLRGVHFAYVRDSRKLEEPPAEYRVNTEIESEGTLVMVLPAGMVVRAQVDSGGSSETKYFFYALGKTFKERVEVTSASHPDIAQALNLASAQ